MSLVARLLRQRDAGAVARRPARLHYRLVDHAILRLLRTNMDQIAPGVWRSNRPMHRRFVALKAMRLRSVLNLRCAAEDPRYLFKKQSCDSLGLRLVNVALLARKAPRCQQARALFEAVRGLEKPILLHCRSGADRAGFASAPCVLAQKGATVAQAWLRQGPIGIEDWFGTDDDHAAFGGPAR